MRFKLMVEATYSVLSKQLKSRWHMAPFVRLTLGAWRCISTHGTVNGVLLGWCRLGDSHVEGSIDAPIWERIDVQSGTLATPPPQGLHPYGEGVAELRR